AKAGYIDARPHMPLGEVFLQRTAGPYIWVIHVIPAGVSGSPGEFNRSVQHQLQSIGRGFEGQGLSRALIEPQSNAIEVGLGEAREIGSSREVLSQQAVGVLVAATLPWTARITEVNLHVGGNREAFVARHLLALVPRQGAS